MRRALFLSLGVVTLGVLLCGSPATAQIIWDDSASTPAESYARGMSSIISSAGDFRLKSSQAAVVGQQAASAAMDNRIKWTETYFDQRAMNRNFRAQEGLPRPTEEELVRFAQAGRPRPLSPSEVDFVSGKISWPRALNTDTFAQERTELESLFEKRAAAGGVSLAEVNAIRSLTSEMLSQLRDQITMMPSSDYLAARRFLESLAFAATQPNT